jgi:hypothetical protein
MSKPIQYSRQHGVAAVEFALLMLYLAPPTFAGIELGRMFYEYNTLVKSTRQAVRAVSLAGSAGEAAARCLAAYGKSTCSGSRLLDGLAPTDVIFVYDTVSIGVANVPVARVEIPGYIFVSRLSWLVPNIPFPTFSATMRQVAP